MATVVPSHLSAAVPEVAVYLKESVGNSTRIDYGTGMGAGEIWMGVWVLGLLISLYWRFPSPYLTWM